MVYVLDFDIVVSEFELRSLCYVHFRTNTSGKGMNPFISPAMRYVVPLVVFCKDGFGIK